jgi:hypothetical protein
MQSGGVRVIKMQDAGYVQEQNVLPQAAVPFNDANPNNTQFSTLPPTNIPVANVQPQNIPIQTVPTPNDDSSSDDETYSDTPSSDSDSDESLTTSSSDTSDDEGGDEDNDNKLSGGARDDDTSSISTADILSKDPLFLVLSEFLMDEEGTNIVTMLGRINKSIKALKTALDHEKQNKGERTKKNKKH